MEEILIRKAKSGDKKAFEELVNKYQRKLYVIARSKIDKEEDIKDVIQETLLTVYIKIDTIKNIDSFNGWITRILLNNCIRILRTQKRVTYSYEEIQNEIELIDDENLEELESVLDVYSAFEEYKERDREIFRMHFSDGYSAKEISEILCMNNDTVRGKLHRFRKKLIEDNRDDYTTL